MDLKWPEMPSNVNFGHPKMANRSEMARNAIESDIRTSKMAAEKKNLYRPEMARIAIESELQTSKMANRSEMDRNAIKSDFRTSKMSAGGHSVKKNQNKIKFRIDLKWPEMRSKVNFGHPKWPKAAILSKNSKK